MSLQLVLAALYPPKNTALEWNENLNWQPIPYNYQELDADTLLLVRKNCPRYHEELDRVMSEDSEVIKCADQYAQLYEELSNITGLSIKTPDDVQSLYSTLKAEVCKNLSKNNFWQLKLETRYLYHMPFDGNDRLTVGNDRLKGIGHE